MTRVVVSDAGPLIALARVRHLDLLRRMYRQIRVPPAVHTEFALRSGRPGARELAHAVEAGWIAVKPLAERGMFSELAKLLGPGEAEAIALAARESTRFLLIDESRGRRVARTHGVPVVGVAGVLRVAKSRGMLAAVRPVLEEMSHTGYHLSSRLVGDVLARAGE